jgi:hypothetical protein
MKLKAQNTGKQMSVNAPMMFFARTASWPRTPMPAT